MSIRKEFHEAVSVLLLKAATDKDSPMAQAQLMSVLSQGMAKLIAFVPPSESREIAVEGTFAEIRRMAENFDREIYDFRAKNGMDQPECNDPDCPVHGDRPIPEDVLEAIGAVLSALSGARK